ncbi:TOBE domain-containing protein [Streptomyces sp. NPDC091212]|uniref:TOBE domain-containing protein n=1 Tax=Streptomyces sp. NPDC091212 TaxID=3155191 RepID=UPI00341AC707
MPGPDRTRDERRAAVRQLDNEGLSARAIATQLNIGKDTVRRDLAALASESADGVRHGGPDTSPEAPDGSASLTAALSGAVRQLAPLGTFSAVTVRLHGAADTVAQPEAPDGAAGGATADGDTLAVALDHDMHEHLAVLAEAGHSAQDAVQVAVAFLADAYRSAWDYDECPRGTRPRLWASCVPRVRKDQ